MASVRDFGAHGDGQADDTAALTHALQQADGDLEFPRGDYRISRPLHVPLDVHGRLGLFGHGTARILMTGPGPALHLTGSHRKNALPANVADAVWQKQRLPTLRGLEIVGAHEEADGIRIDGVMQPTLQGLLIRRCRHGIHLVGLDRNILIADCHVYDNSGVGIFLDHLNLHQIIVHGCHISYCKQGGIVVVASEIRNFQIDSNDIEYNFDVKAPTSADILFDCREGTVREGAIVGNTIQALQSPNGANIRFVGTKGKSTAVGMFAISGNLIGSQETSIHLQNARGVVITGNSLYNGHRHSLLVEDSEHIVIGSNSIDHNSDYKGLSTDQVVLCNSRNVNVSDVILQHSNEPTAPVEASIEVEGCENINITGCQVLGARTRGIRLRQSKVVRIAGCTIRPREGDKEYRAAIEADGQSERLMIVDNFLAKGKDGDVVPGNLVGREGRNVTW